MLDKTQGHAEAETVEKGLGVGIQYQCAVGKNRQITMTAGVPLDWTTPEFNALLDKLGAAMDRQSAKYDLHDLKLALAQTEEDLGKQEQMREAYEVNAQAEWLASNRQGSWKPTGKQTADIGNYKNTSDRIRQHIVKLRKDIKDAEEKCR